MQFAICNVQEKFIAGSLLLIPFLNLFLMTNILVTGANGFIGQHVVKQLLADDRYKVIATGRGVCRLPFKTNDNFKYYSADLSKKNEAEQLFQSADPDVVIHAAALAQPDYCELHKEECMDVNINATNSITELSKIKGSYLLFVSTDFVFSGNDGPYKEDDLTEPVNFYGYSKLKGEEIVQKAGSDFGIIRLCSVYGKSIVGDNRNVVTWVKQNLKKKQAIKVVSDQVRTPTLVEDVVRGIISMVEKKVEGIYHISGEETFTPYDMAIKTAEFYNLDKNFIERVDSSTFSQPAKRPPVTGFIIDKARRELNFSPKNFEEGLGKMDM